MRDYVAVAVLWLLVSALGEWAAGAWIQHLPVVAAREGALSDGAVIFLLRVVVVVFAFVVVALVYSALRFRRRPGDEADSESPFRENGLFSWSWLAMSTALNVLFVIYPGVVGLKEIWASATHPEADLEVDVSARRWEFEFSYPQYGIQHQSSLVLAEGRRVKFVLRSEDVIHSFWIPAFRIKKDVIPGETRYLYLTPVRVLSTREDMMARVQCAELCGAGHPTMRAAVQILKPDDFQTWVNNHRPQGGA